MTGIGGIGTNDPSGPSGNGQVAGTVKLGETFDNFLRLLTTQLQHQDPLAPLDSTEFVSQLVQFSQVEQAIATNQSLNTLVGLQRDIQRAYAVGYLGQTVEWQGVVGHLQDGPVEYSYTLPANATRTVLEIRDEAGRLIRSTPGETGMGRHAFTWDGRDADGAMAPPGSYALTVLATGENDSEIPSLITVKGKVDGVRSNGIHTDLSVGPFTIPFEYVVGVYKDS